MKKILFVVLALIVIAGAWLLITGFTARTDAFIQDYTVSEDGSEMTFTVGVGSSMGFVRGYRDKGGDGLPHYLKFYSAWGGLNSTLGARNSFTLPLRPEETQIYVLQADGSYVLALEKGENSLWSRA